MSAVGFLGQWRGRGWRHLALLIAVSSGATGCKSGSWASAKPSWWSFGQAQPAAGDGLAAAPTFDGDATKPSATAKPYPTTSTPQGYVLDGSGGPPAAESAPVTYGATPPPAGAPANLAQWSPPAPASPAAPGAIAAQVGPYATNAATPANPAAPPATSERSAAVAAVPLPSQPAPAPAAAARMADARAASPDWTGSADALSPSTAASRYGAVGSSRFSGGQDGPAAGAFPAPPGDATPPPAAFPPPTPFSGPAAPPAAMPAVVPAPDALPPLTPPAAAPRRPDPGYRPGGTSSYRPGRSSIAVDGGGVQPASFESRTAIAP